MKNDQISKADWAKIHELSVDAANASAEESETLLEETRVALLSLIDELLSEYGEKASLLSVKASYLEDDQESINLLKKAYALAEKDNDPYTMAEVARDLSSTYWDFLDDWENAKLWNNRLGICLEREADETWQEFYEEMLEKLK
jgi:hypothetical protein